MYIPLFTFSYVRLHLGQKEFDQGSATGTHHHAHGGLWYSSGHVSRSVISDSIGLLDFNSLESTVIDTCRRVCRYGLGEINLLVYHFNGPFYQAKSKTQDHDQVVNKNIDYFHV